MLCDGDDELSDEALLPLPLDDEDDDLHCKQVVAPH